MKSKLSIFFLITVLLITGGYFVWTNYGDDIISRISPTPTLAPEPTTPSDIGVLKQPEDLSGWKQSTTGKYYPWTFKYPSAWKEESDNMDLAFSYIPEPRIADYSVVVNQNIFDSNNESIENIVNSYRESEYSHIIRYEVGTLPKNGNRVYILEDVLYAPATSSEFNKGDQYGVSTIIFIEGGLYRNASVESNCSNQGWLILGTHPGYKGENEYLTTDPYFDTLKQIASTVEFLPCTD